MSDMLPAARGPGRPPRPAARPKLTCRAARRPPCCSSASARSAPRGLQAPQGGGDRAALPRDGEDPAGPDGHERGRVERGSSRRVMAEAYVAEGGVEYAREVLERSVGPDRARELIGRLSATIERRPFEFLRRSPPEQIFAFLRNEAPQTIAVVIANLHTALAAEVLSQLPPEQQAEVALRIGTMTEISPDVTRDVEAVLRQKLSNVDHPGVLRGGRRRVAGRHPQQLRPPDRAQRARLAGRALRRAGRRGPDAPLRLRGHRQARRPQRSSSSSRRSTRRISASRCAA